MVCAEDLCAIICSGMKWHPFSSLRLHYSFLTKTFKTINARVWHPDGVFKGLIHMWHRRNYGWMLFLTSPMAFTGVWTHDFVFIKPLTQTSWVCNGERSWFKSAKSSVCGSRDVCVWPKRCVCVAQEVCVCGPRAVCVAQEQFWLDALPEIGPGRTRSCLVLVVSFAST